MAGIIKKAFLPSERCVGEPFWTIMECHNGNVTGTYLNIQENENADPIIPLFYSNKIAELFLSRYEDADRYCVRGVTQYQLKGLLALEELGHPQFAIFYVPMLLETDDVLISVRLTAKEVAENYLNKYS